MVHRPWTQTVGNVDDHRAAIEILTRAGGVLAELYAERCGGTVARWAAVLAGGDTWFSAREALDAGLTHRIGEATPVAASAARRLRACQADYRDCGKVAAAVRTATEHGITAAARRATGDLLTHNPARGADRDCNAARTSPSTPPGPPRSALPRRGRRRRRGRRGGGGVAWLPPAPRPRGPGCTCPARLQLSSSSTLA
jgi:hypothetical protein